MPYETGSKYVNVDNKTGFQPVSRTCGTTAFGFQDSRKKIGIGTQILTLITAALLTSLLFCSMIFWACAGTIVFDWDAIWNLRP